MVDHKEATFLEGGFKEGAASFMFNEGRAGGKAGGREKERNTEGERRVGRKEGVFMEAVSSCLLGPAERIVEALQEAEALQYGTDGRPRIRAPKNAPGA